MLRLRMKVWTASDGTQFLCPVAFALGKGFLSAYIMRDDKTDIITMTDAQWNSLPFYYFQQDGEAKLAERPAREPDVLIGLKKKE